MSPTPSKMLGLGLSLMPSEVPHDNHVAISSRFPSLCAQSTNDNPISLPGDHR